MNDYTPNRGIRVTNASVPRSYDRNPLTRSFGQDNTSRNLYDAVGYPESRALDFDVFWSWYKRNPYASPIIDRPVDDTWQEPPDISDDVEKDGDDGKDTDFEAAVSDLMDGEATRRSLLDRCHAADRYARVGEFSLMVFGFRGDEDLSEPVEDDAYDGLDGLDYIAVFDQGRVGDIEDPEFLDTDMRSSRYGLPEYYQVEVEDGRTERIHHSRTVHIQGENLHEEDDLRSIPVLMQCANPLLDIEKILAGSAEMFWRGAWQGMVVKPPTDQEGRPYEFNDGGDQLAEQIKEYRHNLRRTVFASGGDIETLGSDVASPADHIQGQIEALSATSGIPQTFIKGNETGERATSEDKERWHQQMGSRRNTYAEPVILRSPLQHLIAKGVLPEPEGSTFSAEWQPLSEPSEQERADIMNTKASALKAASGGQPTRLATIPEIRDEVFEWMPERGAEAPDDVVETPPPELPGASGGDPADDIDESDAEVQEQMERTRTNWSTSSE